MSEFSPLDTPLSYWFGWAGWRLLFCVLLGVQLAVDARAQGIPLGGLQVSLIFWLVVWGAWIFHRNAREERREWERKKAAVKKGG